MCGRTTSSEVTSKNNRRRFSSFFSLQCQRHRGNLGKAVQFSLRLPVLKPPLRPLGLAYLLDPRDRPSIRSPRPSQLLKEKPRCGFQLLGGFKQEPATHTLFALLVGLNFHWIDPQPGSQLLLGEPAEVSPDCNAFSDLNRQIAVEGGR
jgi:hypothetical protein